MEKKLDLILESQEELVFYQWGDLKWAVENTGGMNWEDFILLNLNDPTEDVFAFTFITEYLVEQDMKKAFTNGYFRKEDYIERVDTIIVKHPAMTCNDLGCIIRLWINKLYPYYATNQ